MIKVDPEFQWIVDKFPWRVGDHGYAIYCTGSHAKKNFKTHYLHRLVFSEAKGLLPKIVDHINQNKLDCRLENLRAATKSLNNMNRTGATGVSFRTGRARGWKAQVSRHNRTVYLGNFFTQEEAMAKAKEAREIIAEFEALKAS